MPDGHIEAHRISRGTGTKGERFWCRVRGGHRLGERVPDWFPNGPGRICTRCGGVYDVEIAGATEREVKQYRRWYRRGG